MSFDTSVVLPAPLHPANPITRNAAPFAAPTRKGAGAPFSSLQRFPIWL